MSDDDDINDLRAIQRQMLQASAEQIADQLIADGSAAPEQRDALVAAILTKVASEQAAGKFPRHPS